MFQKSFIRLMSIPALFLCLGIFINEAYAAATYYDKSTAGSDSINLSSPKAPKTEGNTGTLRYEYGFSLPAGRSSVQPDISLNYSSADESNQNLAGYGWSLNLPNITRINTNGFESMYAENNFIASQYGELLQSTTSNIFIAKKGDLSRAEFINLTSGWEVKDASGMTYVYGSTPESRIQDEATSRIYGWYLTDATDVFGNNVHYEYVKDDNFVYPYKITYTNHPSAQGIYEIRFNFESRSDSLSSYASGFLVKNNKRLTSVEVYVSGVKRKSFTFRYGQGVNGLRSLLLGIVESGHSSTGAVQNLPETTFEYSQPQTEERQFTVYGEFDRLADVNGDGLTDLVLAKKEQTNPYGDYKVVKEVQVNKNNLQFEKVSLQDTFINQSATSTQIIPDKTQVPVIFNQKIYTGGGALVDSPQANFFVDTNADGYTDIVSSGESYIGNPTKEASSSTLVATSTLFFEQNSSTTLPVQASGLSTLQADGDKKPDFLLTSNSAEQQLYELNENGQILQKTDSNSLTFNKWNFYSQENKIFQVVDVNADGLDDMVQVYTDVPYLGAPIATTTNIWLNKGGVLELLDATSSAQYNIPSFLNKSTFNTQFKNVIFTDANFDGINDVYSPCEAYLVGSGSGFETTTNNCISNGTGVSAVDFNGDGLSDIFGLLSLNDSSTFSYWVRLSKQKADLLQKIKNQLGGETSIEYAPASSYLANTGEVANKISYPAWTVKKEISSDGLGNSSTREHSYEGAYIDRSEKFDSTLTGFGKVTSVEPNGLKQITYYHQGNGNDVDELNDSLNKVGKSYKVQTCNSNGQLENEQFISWKDTGSVSLPGVSVQKVYDVAGSGEVFATANKTEYDVNFNKTKETNYKDVTFSFGTSSLDLVDIVATDTLVTEQNYINSTSNPKRFFPKQKFLKDFEGKILLEEKNEYDNQSSTADKGLLTKKSITASTTEKVETYTWDNSFGLMSSSVNSRGATTSNSYDGFNIFPISIYNALGQASNFEHDYLSGNKTRAIGLNGDEVQTEYDALGRVSKVFKVEAGSPQLIESREYTDTYLPQVKQTKYSSATNSVSTYSFYDGFGRVVKQTGESYVDGDYATKDIFYNNVGKVYKETLPYKTNSVSRVQASAPAYMNVNYIMDNLGRITETQNALGVEKAQYFPRRKIVSDKNNHPTEFTYTPDGLISRVREYNQGQEYITNYMYDVLGNLQSIQDAEGGVRSLSFDSLGRKLEDTLTSKSLDKQKTIFQYANNDSYVSKTMPDGIELRSNFDILGRKIQDTSSESVATTTMILIGTTTVATTTYSTSTQILSKYTYDACLNGLGRLCVASSSDGVIKTYEYTKDGKVSTESVNVQNATWSPNSTVKFVYDLLGNLVSRSDGKSTTTYDYYRNLISGISYNAGATTTNVLSAPIYDYAGRVMSYSRGPLETQNSFDIEKMNRMQGTLSFMSGTSSYPFEPITLEEISTSTQQEVTYFPAEYKKESFGMYALSRGTGSPTVWPTPPYYQYATSDTWYQSGSIVYKSMNWSFPTGYVASNRGSVDNTLDLTTIWSSAKNASTTVATNPTVDLYVVDKVLEMNDDKAYVQVFQRNATNTLVSAEMFNQCNTARPYSGKISLSTILPNKYLTIPLNENFLQDYLDYSTGAPSAVSSCILEGHTIENDSGAAAGAAPDVNKRNMLKLQLNYADLASSTASRPMRSAAEIMYTYSKENSKPVAQSVNVKKKIQGLYPELQIIASDPDKHTFTEGETYVSTSSSTSQGFKVSSPINSTSTATVSTLVVDYPFEYGKEYFLSSRVKDYYGAWSNYATTTYATANLTDSDFVKVSCPGKDVTSIGSVNCPNPNFTFKLFDEGMAKYSNYQNYFKPHSVAITVATTPDFSQPVKVITSDIPSTSVLGSMYTARAQDLRLKKNTRYYYKLDLTFGWYNYGGTQFASTYSYTQSPYIFYTGDFKTLQNIDYKYDSLSRIKEILKDSDLKFEHSIYSYDELSRLLVVEKNSSRDISTTTLAESFVYSPTGRILNNSGVTYNYADSSNYFTPVSIGNDSIVWDARGRMGSSTSIGELQWGNLDRVKEIKKATSTSKYFYDTEGNRALSLVFPSDANSASSTQPLKQLFTPDPATQVTASTSIYQISFAGKPIIQTDTAFATTSVATTSTTTAMVPMVTTTLIATTTYLTVSTTTPVYAKKLYYYLLGNRETTVPATSTLRYDEFASGTASLHYTLDNYAQATSTYIVPVATSTLNNFNSWIGVRECPQNCQNVKQRFTLNNLIPGDLGWLYVYGAQRFGSQPFKFKVISGTEDMLSAYGNMTIGTYINSYTIRPRTTSLTFEIESSTTTVNNYVYFDMFEIELRNFYATGKTVSTTTQVATTTMLSTTTTILVPTEVATTTMVDVATTTTKIFSLLTDHLGSTEFVLDFDSGEEVASTTQTSFGTESVSGSKTSNRSFTNHQSDQPDTSLNYMNARYQSPNYGIFISTDEVTDSLGNDQEFTQKYLHNPQGLNPYTYALNSPGMYVDPDGKMVRVYAKELNGTTIGTHTFIVTYKDDGKSCGLLNIYSGTSGPNGDLVKTKSDKDDSSVFFNGFSRKINTMISFGGSKPKNVEVKVGNLKDSQNVEIPEGFSESTIIDNIEREYQAFPDNMKYSAFTIEGGINSNVFTTTVLKNAGVKKLPWNGDAPGVDPGYGDIINTSIPAATGQKNNPNGKLEVMIHYIKYLLK